MSATVKRFPQRLNVRGGSIDMTHGSGGRAMAQLIDELFMRQFHQLPQNPPLDRPRSGGVWIT